MRRFRLCALALTLVFGVFGGCVTVGHSSIPGEAHPQDDSYRIVVKTTRIFGLPIGSKRYVCRLEKRSINEYECRQLRWRWD